MKAAEFRRIRRALGSEDVSAPLEAAYITGWRLASEILSRQWKHVDFAGGWLRLSGETKNRKGRMFPLTPDLRAVLERQRARADAVEGEAGQIIPWVLHRNGRPIVKIEKDWDRAIAASGLEGRLPHDFRRTAAHNLIRAGISEQAAMKPSDTNPIDLSPATHRGRG